MIIHRNTSIITSKELVSYLKYISLNRTTKNSFITIYYRMGTISEEGNYYPNKLALYQQKE